MPMDQGEFVWVEAASPKQIRPQARYHTPTTKVERGRKRQEANTPRENKMCQSPGSSHSSCGATSASATVTNPPATTGGRIAARLLAASLARIFREHGA